MIVSFAIFVLAMIALAVFAVEYADRHKRKQRMKDIDYLRGHIEQAQRRHEPRKHLFRQLVEARRKELANGQ